VIVNRQLLSATHHTIAGERCIRRCRLSDELAKRRDQASISSTRTIAGHLLVQR